MQAVAVVVGGHQLQHDELASLRHGQVDAQTEAGGGREGQTQAVALAGQTPHAAAGRHVLQHVGLQQAALLLQCHTFWSSQFKCLLKSDPA